MVSMCILVQISVLTPNGFLLTPSAGIAPSHVVYNPPPGSFELFTAGVSPGLLIASKALCVASWNEEVLSPSGGRLGSDIVKIYLSCRKKYQFIFNCGLSNNE